MSINKLTAWLLTIGPIGMFVIWGIIDPMVLGEVADGLAPVEEATANIQRYADNEVTGWILSLSGGFSMLGMMVGLGLLAKSMQAGGATLGSLCGYIFPALVAMMVFGFGSEISGQEILVGGNGVAGDPELGGMLSLVGNSAFGAFPIFWGLGLTLLGLGITREDGPLPSIMGWIMTVMGVVMFSMSFGLGDGIGFFAWIGASLVVSATGVLSLLAIRKAAAA